MQPLPGNTLDGSGRELPTFTTRLAPADATACRLSRIRSEYFLINTVVENAGTTPITLLQNWHPELKK